VPPKKKRKEKKERRRLKALKYHSFEKALEGFYRVYC
jgi:hypothetical protein